jgi:hypothetical protein
MGGGGGRGERGKESSPEKKLAPGHLDGTPSPPVAVDATISVPEAAHFSKPVGGLVQKGDVGDANGLAVPFPMAVAPTARM